MTAAELLADCQAREIVLTAQGDRLEIDAPETELTPDLLARLQAHKSQLLEILTPEAPAAGCDPPAPAPRDERPADLQPLADAPADLQPLADAPADLAVEWVERTGPDGRAIIERTDAGPGWDEAIEPPPPCPYCAGLEQWQSMAGDWRCLKCDPPHTTGRLKSTLRRDMLGSELRDSAKGWRLPEP